MFWRTMPKNTTIWEHWPIDPMVIKLQRKVDMLERWVQEDNDALFHIWKTVHLKDPSLIPWKEIEAMRSRRYPQN